LEFPPSISAGAYRIQYPFDMNCLCHPVTCAAALLAGIAEDVYYGAVFVKRGAPASSGCSTRYLLYFFGRQLAGAHAIQYSVRHELLLFQ